MSEGCCYLTTTGRLSGEPREVELWFERERDTVFMLSGNGVLSAWVRNILAQPSVSVRIGAEKLEGRARVVGDDEEIARVRELVAAKYERLDTAWRREGVPVAIALERPGGQVP
ncbi:MAG TPA: nitroreductase/quinone reductase family protein [Thermoleophilaceae bacterium]|nr:nitroreductase/quinone reductase family protein [Thermoleophilaceae bacterium]